MVFHIDMAELIKLRDYYIENTSAAETDLDGTKGNMNGIIEEKQKNIIFLKAFVDWAQFWMTYHRANSEVSSLVSQWLEQDAQLAQDFQNSLTPTSELVQNLTKLYGG